MTRVAQRGLVVAMLVVLPMLAAAPAQAHTELVAASPAAGSRLAVAPPTVSLRFTDPVIGGVSHLSVRGPDGHDHVVGAPSVLGGDLQVRLTGLDRAGTYRVDFRVVGVDGHPVSGGWDFALTEAAARGAAELPVGLDKAAAALVDQTPSADPTTLGLLLLALGVASTLVVRRVILAVRREER